MRLLVFGKTGQVATELARRLPAAMQAEFLGRDAADLTDPLACAAAIAERRPAAVINAAAWTAVDKAESEEAAARLVNADAPAAMAGACAKAGIPFLHLSTDYVFSGAGDQPFRPEDPVAPLGVYGRTKWQGEEAVRAAGGQHLILRTAWVFSAHGANFVKTMLRLGRERDVLRVVDDQHGGPTPAAAIADALLIAARAMQSGAMQAGAGQTGAMQTGAMQAGAAGGTHHFSGAPDTTWADFAREIMARAGLSCRIEGIPTRDYPTPAQRPLNSRLDCTAFEAAFGIPRPDWRAGLDEVLKELAA